MSGDVKFVVLASSSVAAFYFMYKFWKRINVSQVPTANTEDEVLNSDEVSQTNIVEKDSYEEYDVNATVAEKKVRPDGVQLWIDEAVEEYYSFNDGPSSFDNIKQDIWDNLMQSDVWKERTRENVTRYVKDFLTGDRPIYIPKKRSPEVPDVSSPDSDEEISSKEQEIEIMCNQYFGITRHEYFALEEEAAKRLSGERPGYIEKVIDERRVRIAHDSEEKDDKLEKKPKKGWKRWKKRMAKFFKLGKDCKSK